MKINVSNNNNTNIFIFLIKGAHWALGAKGAGALTVLVPSPNLPAYSKHPARARFKFTQIFFTHKRLPFCARRPLIETAANPARTLSAKTSSLQIDFRDLLFL